MIEAGLYSCERIFLTQPLMQSKKISLNPLKRPNPPGTAPWEAANCGRPVVVMSYIPYIKTRKAHHSSTTSSSEDDYCSESSTTSEESDSSLTSSMRSSFEEETRSDGGVCPRFHNHHPTLETTKRISEEVM